jgi:hypothetical protein
MNYNTGDFVLDLTNVKNWSTLYANKLEVFMREVHKIVKDSDSQGFIIGSRCKTGFAEPVFSDNPFNIYVFNQNGICDIAPKIRLYNLSQDKDGLLKEISRRVKLRKQAYGPISDEEMFSLYIPIMQEAAITNFGAMLD